MAPAWITTWYPFFGRLVRLVDRFSIIIPKNFSTTVSIVQVLWTSLFFRWANVWIQEKESDSDRSGEIADPWRSRRWDRLPWRNIEQKISRHFLLAQWIAPLPLYQYWCCRKGSQSWPHNVFKKVKVSFTANYRNGCGQIYGVKLFSIFRICHPSIYCEEL